MSQCYYYTHWHSVGVFPPDFLALGFPLLERMLFLVLELHFCTMQTSKFGRVVLSFCVFGLVVEQKQSMADNNYCDLTGNQVSDCSNGDGQWEWEAVFGKGKMTGDAINEWENGKLKLCEKSYGNRMSCFVNWRGLHQLLL